MLNALELVGFKSFPDRTRFDFPAGITVVVGPNGSGKSNIVDAIKWVLGEQSARSLRGKEMADVIFKGSSGPSGRKPSNSAEATIYIDNRNRLLRMDCDEILVTRRVYRSGEGEYLLNHEPCRLKDIRNLFRGTGIGTDAYSLIEQGKVDQLLQASAKDRRAMFEEAAGISRFKAKKVETERRLSRVEQNLVRLADIVDEVEGNYKRVKSQASKATRYKEYTDRLRSLRTHVGSKDWRDFTQTLDEIIEQKDALAALVDEKQSELTELESSSLSLDQQLSENSNQVADLQSALSSLMQSIAECQSGIALASNRSEDFQQQSQTLRQSLQQLSGKLRADNELQVVDAQSLASAEADLAEHRQQLESCDTKLESAIQRIDELRSKVQSDQTALSECQASVSQIGQEISAQNSQLAAQGSVKTKLLESMRQAENSLAEKNEQLASVQETQNQLQRDAEEKDSTLRVARQQLEEIQALHDEEKSKLNQLYRDQAGFKQRADLIQELEKQQEGVDAGVKQLIKQAADQPDSSFGEVVGLVADLIKVNVQHAALIDLALGDRAQHVVVNGKELIAAVANGSLRLGGRVGLIQQFPERTATGTERFLQEQAGVIGRLDQLVHANSEYHQVIRHLLGQTWLVKTLDVAMQLHEMSTSPTTRFITLEGEVVEADGSVICGSRTSSTGIVSRRSELRDLHHRLTAIEKDIHESSDYVTKYAGKVKRQQATIEELLGEHSELSDKLTDARTRSSLLESETGQLQNQLKRYKADLQDVLGLLSEVQKKVTHDQQRLAKLHESQSNLAESIERGQQELAEQEQQRDASQQLLTTQKVSFAKCEQQVAELRSRNLALESRLQENQQHWKENRGQLATLLWSRRSALRTIVEGEAKMASLSEQRVELESQLAEYNAARQAADRQRRENSKTLGSAREVLRKTQEELHDFQMREKDLSMQRSQLAIRLKDDYDIDIETLQVEAEAIDEDREAIDQEINDLRTKLNNIGPVNMDALNELESLEGRYQALSDQYRDLVDAKETLEKIIVRINNDSRKLFVETLEQIRTNFQQLFRLTFGGGHADLILEEGVDVLEAGIDIRATPPGKPEFNNSLLSGGEKALTAVSLMMAIFKFRPSPFCILDEVDAPFDEANVGRFVGVLQSFLSWTKFVIVTHSKKTMTAATTLYGITMQESGVSKRVSVKFEDVNEKGQISEAALERQADEQIEKRA